MHKIRKYPKSTAKKLIDAANACNWDCVKFQKRDPDVCVPKDQKKIRRDTPWGEMTYIEYKHKVEFESEEYNEIDYSNSLHIFYNRYQIWNTILIFEHF